MFGISADCQYPLMVLCCLFNVAHRWPIDQRLLVHERKRPRNSAREPLQRGVLALKTALGGADVYCILCVIGAATDSPARTAAFAAGATGASPEAPFAAAGTGREEM
jgi:hypothetical protein